MALHQACKVAGVGPYSPHDLRHRYISLQVLAGVPITVVKERAGHANASMTLDIYSHVILED